MKAITCKNVKHIIKSEAMVSGGVISKKIYTKQIICKSISQLQSKQLSNKFPCCIWLTNLANKCQNYPFGILNIFLLLM